MLLLWTGGGDACWFACLWRALAALAPGDDLVGMLSDLGPLDEATCRCIPVLCHHLLAHVLKQWQAAGALPCLHRQGWQQRTRPRVADHSGMALAKLCDLCVTYMVLPAPMTHAHHAAGPKFRLLGAVLWGPICGALHEVNAALRPRYWIEDLLVSEGLLDPRVKSE